MLRVLEVIAGIIGVIGLLYFAACLAKSEIRENKRGIK